MSAGATTSFSSSSSSPSDTFRLKQRDQDTSLQPTFLDCSGESGEEAINCASGQKIFSAEEANGNSLSGGGGSALDYISRILIGSGNNGSSSSSSSSSSSVEDSSYSDGFSPSLFNSFSRNETDIISDTLFNANDNVSRLFGTGFDNIGPTTIGIGNGFDITTEAGILEGVDAPISWSSWVLVALFTTLIVITMVGNVLVCLSVILVRKLRKPQNYLLVSLAISDLFVAIFVMPFAVAFEVSGGTWPFNNALCDLWVSADVLCCTASILNLCGISVDRYRAITTPLEYSSKTTPRRMLAVIFVVWLGSACVSLPPVLLLGNVHKDIHENSYCSVSQNFWYQIYATMASFYVPLCVMVVVYVKILRVVADKKKQMGWKPAHPHQSIHRSSSITTNHSSSFGGGGLVVSGSPGGGCGPPPPHALVTRALVTSSVGGSPVTVTTLVSSSTSSPIRRNSLSTMSTITAGPTSAAPTPPPAARGSPAAPTNLLASNSVDASNVNNNKKDSTGSQNAAATTPLLKSGRRGSNTSVKNNYLQQKQKGSRKSSHNSLNVHHNHSHQNGGNGSAVTYFFSSTAIHRIKKEKLFGGLKEHKASTVLGIIMSAFVICWLPFFVLALVRPFLSINGIEIPPWMGTLFNWLGYANSALNPVIYATLNRDFRKPFREILCLRCSTLDDMMRREFYHQQYGDDHDRENYLRRLSRPQTENEVSYATEGPTNV